MLYYIPFLQINLITLFKVKWHLTTMSYDWHLMIKKKKEDVRRKEKRIEDEKEF